MWLQAESQESHSMYTEPKSESVKSNLWQADLNPASTTKCCSWLTLLSYSLAPKLAPRHQPAMITASRCPPEVQCMISAGKLQQSYKTCLTPWGSGSGGKRDNVAQLWPSCCWYTMPAKTWLPSFDTDGANTFKCCLQKVPQWQAERWKSSIWDPKKPNQLRNLL